MTGKQATPNNLLKKLYVFTKNKQKAFKDIIPVHKHIFLALQHGQLQIADKKVPIQKEIAQYKPENKLIMDEEVMFDCVSVYDIFLGKQAEKEKYNQRQRKILKRQEERLLEKQKSQKSLHQKQIQYKERVKQWQSKKEKVDEIKKAEQAKRLQLIAEEQQKARRERQMVQERKKQQKRLKLQAGLKEMQQKRRKRQQMVKQLAIEQKRSQSMKTLKNLQPKYLQLQKQYLQKQRRKIQQFKQLQKQKRQSMILKMEQINSHQKQYLEKLKQKFTKNGGTTLKLSSAQFKSRKAKSQFNVIKTRDQEEDQKYRQKINRRKQFQNKLRNIPIHIDINKKKQKQIEVDKAVNKQKYILLAKRNLDDDQIFTEFKDFQIKNDPKIIGKNYLEELKLLPKAPKSQRLRNQSSQSKLPKQLAKSNYVNYLEEFRSLNKGQRKSEPKLKQNDELLKLVQKSKKLLKKHYEEQENIFAESSHVSLKNSKIQKQPDIPTKIKEKQLKAQVTKSITEKIQEYQRKVLKKVNDLKKMSQYEDSIKQQKDIDDLFSKVLKAKIDTIDMT